MAYVPTQRLSDKVHRLLEQRRVVLRGDLARVIGDTSIHSVRFDQWGVTCDCEAARTTDYCSHKLAAMVAANEEDPS